MKLTLGFSPCPNDTFIFDAIVNQKIDLMGLEFEEYLADVEELNQLAFKKVLDITKLSYHTFAYLANDYQLLDSGSALGNNCGPLLIAKRDKIDEIRQKLANNQSIQIAIPGKFTTANFLLGLAYPHIENKVEMLFSDIEAAVIHEKVDAGLIIHENRFTYQEKGLEKIIDLGEYWESTTQMPIPLGGIVIKRSLPTEIKQKVNQILRKSVEVALANPQQTLEYVRPHAQTMSEKVMFQHIGLYVNDYSVSLSEKGRGAIQTMFDIGRNKGVIPDTDANLFE